MSNLTSIELFHHDLRAAINAGHQHTRDDLLRRIEQMDAMINNQREIIDNQQSMQKFMEEYLTSLRHMLADHDNIHAGIIGGGNA